MQVLMFPTEADATTALDTVNTNMRAMASDAGYVISEDGYIYGNNAATGEPDLEAAPVTTWDVVTYAPDLDMWWFRDPAIRHDGASLDQIMDGVSAYTRMLYSPPSVEELTEE